MVGFTVVIYALNGSFIEIVVRHPQLILGRVDFLVRLGIMKPSLFVGVDLKL